MLLYNHRFQVETLLREANIKETDFRYYANADMDSWPKFLATLCIIANEAIGIRATLEQNNERAN